MNENIQTITVEIMQALQMKDDEFRKYLNESMSPSGDTYIKSKTTILNMRVRGIPPRTDVLQDILSVYKPSDKRFRFALRMLIVTDPHIWGSQGVVWRLKPSILAKVVESDARRN